MRGARISDVRVAAAHDGAAEMVVVLRHDNGGTSDVILDEVAAAALFRACQADAPEDLIGHGWEKLKEALGVSWNRFTNTQ